MRNGKTAILVCLTLALGACASRGRATTAPAPSGDRASLRTAIDSMIADAKFRTARWGILIVDPERGDTLYSHDAAKLFVPASNEKIITSAVSLAQLGPDYRFGTMFVAMGAISGGVLAGDLIVNGTGDPSVSDHMVTDAMGPLRAIADSLVGRGVHRIAGALRTGTDAFPGPTLGFGWEWDDLDFAYSAGVDELYFNEGFARVIVRAGATPAEPPTARTAPARHYPVVRIAATTSPRGSRSRLQIRSDSTVPGGVVVTGTIAEGDSATLTIAHRDPTGAYLAALREALEERGIIIDGETIATHQASDVSRAGSAGAMEPPGYPLFSTYSPPLSQILPALMKPSQNQIAEIMLRTLGRERAAVGTPDSGARVVRNQLMSWGVAADGFVVHDGSGLSRHDVVSPETLVRILDAMRKHQAFQVFYDAMPIAGVDGTISRRMRGTPAEANIHAKTGTLDMARSLSGYVTTRDGRRLIFSVLCNHYTVPTAEVDRVADNIGARLASLGAAK